MTFHPSADELSEYNARLQKGLATLARAHNIDVGVSPRQCVYHEPGFRLYRYESTGTAGQAIPVLIVYALVNRPYMADLEDGRSLVQGLLNQGLDVYLVEWSTPAPADRGLALDDYIEGYVNACVDWISRATGWQRIYLLGICQGGVFGLCYTALFPDKVAGLITTVTPVDFHTPDDLLSHLVRYIDIDLCVDTLGNVPGEFLNTLFLSLKPFRLMSQKYMDFMDILDDEQKVNNFLRMEKWIFESPDQAGAAFRYFVKTFYQQNGLIRGKVRIGGKRVALENIRVPVLNIYARDDHLVPPDASRALAEYVGTDDYREIEFPGGHIGIYVSQRAQSLLPPAIASWLQERQPA